MFIERIIYRILTNEIEAFKSDPAAFEAFIYSGTKSTDEAAKARAYFELHPPTVIHGFPRTDSVFPCIAIVLAGEGIAQDYIGEDAYNTDENGMMFLDSDGMAMDMHVRRWNHNFDALIYADHPDICLYYYNLARQILMAGKNEFIRNDYDQVSFTGADLAPDPRYSPEFLFLRRLGISLQSDLTYSTKENSFYQSYRMQGIGVDPGEPLSSALTPAQANEITQLERGVTTFLPED